MMQGINRVDLDNSKNKLQMYSKEESILIDSIDKEIDTINSMIKIKELENPKFELMKKLKVFKNTHYNSTLVIERVIDKYINVRRSNIGLFTK